MLKSHVSIVRDFRCEGVRARLKEILRYDRNQHYKILNQDYETRHHNYVNLHIDHDILHSICQLLRED